MKDLNANATKWLESIGYPAASLTTPMEGKKNMNEDEQPY